MKIHEKVELYPDQIELSPGQLDRPILRQEQ